MNGFDRTWLFCYIARHKKGILKKDFIKENVQTLNAKNDIGCSYFKRL